MKDNSKIISIILAIFAIVVLVVSFITRKDKSNEISIVTNYSDFYTVNSCLYRTITHLSAKDTDSLMLLLSDQYKKENKITKDNIINVFPVVTENSTFVSEKMYYEVLSNTLYKYYVKGYIDENKIYDDENLGKVDREYTYFIVYLDSSNNIFSIELYDGNIFKDGGKHE